MSTQSSNDLDSDPTDELPVLLETVALDEHAPPLLTERHEDTGENEALPSPDGNDAESAARLAALAESAEQIPSLEAQIGVLTDSVRDLEQKVAEKDRRIEELNDKVAKLRRATEEAVAAERHLATQVALRDGQVAELAANAERFARDAGAAAGELAQLRGLAAAAHRETEALRSELAVRPARAGASQDVQELREDHAALVAYIAAREASWDDMQSMSARLGERVAALEHELESAAKRLAAADSLAKRESSRAVALRAELVDSTRRVDSLERELRLARGAATSPVVAHDAAPARAPSSAGLRSDAAARDGPAAYAKPREAPPVLTDAVVDAAGQAVEDVGQLEAEVAYKRQQVAAQLVELRDRDQRLRDATSELEQVRRELAILRRDFDESRSNVARLELDVIDKDRAIAARDSRIAMLHDELAHRIGAGKRSSGDVSFPASDAPAAARSASREGSAEHTSVPALLCLTGDAPKRFALTKNIVTVGRGPHCDLQILTHFVSREHARVTLSGEAAVIEDLGSRNGVFVNAVRVDRRHLQQGDLITIGETQFRFVESMAH